MKTISQCPHRYFCLWQFQSFKVSGIASFHKWKSSIWTATSVSLKGECSLPPKITVLHNICVCVCIPNRSLHGCVEAIALAHIMCIMEGNICIPSGLVNEARCFPFRYLSCWTADCWKPEEWTESQSSQQSTWALRCIKEFQGPILSSLFLFQLSKRSQKAVAEPCHKMHHGSSADTQISPRNSHYQMSL